MANFECSVERRDEFVVEFDTDVIDQAWLDHFKRYFYDFDTLQEHAEHIAQHRARFGTALIEGYGVPLENGMPPFYHDSGAINNAINIKIISEDTDIYVYSHDVI